MQHDVKKSFLSDAFNGAAQMLHFFWCFSLMTCSNSVFFTKMNFCVSFVLVLTNAFVPLKQAEDLVFCKFLACWCTLLMCTLNRRFVDFCKTTPIALYNSCKHDLQELIVPVFQTIVPCIEVLLQWEPFIMLLSLLFLLLQLFIHQIVQVAIICHFLKLVLINYLPYQ